MCFSTHNHSCVSPGGNLKIYILNKETYHYPADILVRLNEMKEVNQKFLY